jgi:hypothetical protein
VKCEVCRLRKTRCDAAKPSCSFCRKLDIPCVYRGPSKDDRARDDEDETTSRLTRIESSLNTVEALVRRQQGTQTTVLQSRQAQQQSLPFDVVDGLLSHATPQSFRSEPAATSPAVTISQSSRPATARRLPNLFTFEGPAPWSYNCTEDFFAHQLANITDVRTLQQTPDVDLTRPQVWRLQQSFVENVLKWLPLFDDETALEHLQAAHMSKYQGESPSLSLVFLMFAIGSLALDSSLYSAKLDDLPGAGFYLRAFEIMKSFPPLSTDLCILQCRTLEA